MAKDLTAVGIKAIKPGLARCEIPDGNVRGLFLVVQPSGAMSWAVRYRVDGKPKKHTLGSYPALSIEAARKHAKQAVSTVASGTDPAAERKANREAARAAERAEKHTVEAVAKRFLREHAERRTRVSSSRETSRIFDHDILPTFGKRQLCEVKRSEVRELLAKIVDRGSPIAANRTLSAFRRLCNWAKEQEIITASPCENVKPPADERTRDRVLTDDEIRLIWRACGTIGWPFGPIVKLLLLTGQRRREVGEMRWAEVDFATATWTIPRERAKNDQAHIVPLSPRAVAILELLPTIAGKAGLVFTTSGETPVSGYSKAKSIIDRLIGEYRAEDRADGEPEPDSPSRWTFHDLRRTTATGMARLGVNLPVIERILNHISGSFAGIVGVYQRHAFGDEKRTALEAWGHFVERVGNGKATDNVVELRERVSA